MFPIAGQVGGIDNIGNECMLPCMYGVIYWNYIEGANLHKICDE